jgi:hypothetical protein
MDALGFALVRALHAAHYSISCALSSSAARDGS